VQEFRWNLVLRAEAKLFPLRRRHLCGGADFVQHLRHLVQGSTGRPETKRLSLEILRVEECLPHVVCAFGLESVADLGNLIVDPLKIAR